MGNADKPISRFKGLLLVGFMASVPFLIVWVIASFETMLICIGIGVAGLIIALLGNIILSGIEKLPESFRKKAEQKIAFLVGYTFVAFLIICGLGIVYGIIKLIMMAFN